MRFFTRALILFLALGASSRAATWYVDSQSFGAGTGASWADAWTKPSDVVWGGAGVKAGDTLFLSGGTYTNKLIIGAGGTSDSSRITIAPSNEEGHNSLVVLPGISLNGKQWITIDGWRDTNVPLPYAGQIQDTPSSLTGNLGIRITTTFPGTHTQGIYVDGAAGANNTIRGVEIGPISTDVDDNTYDGFGIRFLNLTTNANFRVEGVWIHDCRTDGVNLNDISGGVPSGHRATVFKSCWITDCGDDGIQWTEPGLALVDCFLSGHHPTIYHGHPDHWQLSGSASKYAAAINCIFGPNANSIIKAEMLVTEGGTYGDIVWVGNIHYSTRDWAWTFGEPLGFQAWRPNASTNVLQATQANVYFFNNTFYYLKAGSGLPWFVGRALPGNDLDDQDTKSALVITATNGWFGNNLGVDLRWNSPGQNALSWSGDGPGGGPSDNNGIYYASNQVRWVNNVLAGSETRFRYAGQSYTTGESLGMGNKSSMPKLANTNVYNFRLDPSDTVAAGQGLNWGAVDGLTNVFPEAMRDAYGNPRFRSGGLVDIGAAALAPNPLLDGLLLWIRFDDAPADADDGYDDWSGNTNHALHLAYFSHHSESNRVPQQTNWVHPVKGTTEVGARMIRYQDGWDEYNETGSHLGVTRTPSTNPLWLMEEATISFWGRYDASPPGSSGYLNWNAHGNRRFLSGGYGYTGAWTIGLLSDSDPRTGFRIYTADNASADAKLKWTDRINISTQQVTTGSSTNMRLYTATFSRGLVTLYLDAVQVAQRQFTNSAGAPITNLTIRGPSGTRAGMLEIGGDSHNANPLLTYIDGNGILRGDDGDGTFFETTGAKQVPNHGWAGPATMDEVMIWNRRLSTDEIDTLYRGDYAPSGGGGGGGGGGGSGGRHNIRATGKLSVGKLL